MSGPRHARQLRVREVGLAGQARIEAGCVHIACSGLAGRIEARYLAGAGVRSLHVIDETQATAIRDVDGGIEVIVDGAARPEHTGPCVLRDRTANDVFRGAHAALVALRRLLDLDAPR